MAEIPLRARNGSVRAVALVDDEDYEWLRRWRWAYTSVGYATRGETRGAGRLKRTYYMHREILGLTPGDGLHCHHRNGDRLDNRRANLLAVPAADHRALHGEYDGESKGVYLEKRTGHWQARVWDGDALRNLGTYASPEEAEERVRGFRAQR